ncbi:glycosyltransferase [Sphingobacterium faecium]|uniref:glycosyltransferase family 4 protein n=1 Tax=Sphingobacterium faecium TaxID=34087 RepID=UPI0012912124|nr:glycosyltransferase family 4 protein [Sphingobacterium faecium]MQP26733.1 glycosyltransferase [Sphingobacterium faecium]
MKTLLILTNVDWFLISHRLILAKAAVAAGWKVYVACEDTGKAQDISVDGIEFIDFPFSRSGINPIEEFKLYKRFIKLYKEIKPDVIHQITIKPVVYGSIAAQKLNIKGVVNAISGMGYMFTKERLGLVQKVLLYLMKMGSNRNNVSFIFQNDDDLHALKLFGILENVKSINLIKGSGIDLNKFAYTELPDDLDRIKILFPSRMLFDKGVRELIEASKLLKAKYHDKIQFLLVGKADTDNKSAVSAEILNSWCDGDYVRWCGHIEDMVQLYKDAHIIVLPSYREGLPKSLIEACAIGRPIVTTDAIGCRDCVDEGVNGFKVAIRDSLGLANALEVLISNPQMRKEMGIAGRKKAEIEFDVQDVINKHLEIYSSYLN